METNSWRGRKTEQKVVMKREDSLGNVRFERPVQNPSDDAGRQVDTTSGVQERVKVT